jgi:uncharacterized protein YdhG (YjbR/CyaY superfamily)
MSKIKPANVDDYINAAPVFAREKLQEIRSILKKAAPNAEELLKWGHPCFMEKRILFSYAAHKTHINFVPTGPAMAPFVEELSEFNTGKDSFQMPYDRPLPVKLIQKIAEYRIKDVRENDAKWMY